jgi:sulfur-oxidizing protein SoxA
MRHILQGLLLVLPAGEPRRRANAPGKDTRRSGFEDMGASTQAMQKDDTLNPGMLWVQGRRGAVEAAGRRQRQGLRAATRRRKAACAAWRRVIPAFDDRLGRPITLGQRINQCRQQHQQAAPLRAESPELLGLEAYVALQSRGLPLAPPDDARLEPFRQRGQQLFTQRIGQLNLSCAQCHDGLAGKRLAGSLIPQAHPTGYPVYRLEWQAMGSLQRRLRGCMSGVRAEPFAYGAQELVELELYLNRRAQGMHVESPGVRP